MYCGDYVIQVDADDALVTFFILGKLSHIIVSGSDGMPNKVPNRLINEKSPYLLQHAYNPVDWYHWGEEAFARAAAEDKPIFLSIGYSTCHWCHVMERESFEDEEVAEVLNRYFISIKVDREERPDIDSIYMEICQAITGRGGWPLTILMTPDKKPFYAGTYFPKDDRRDMPGLMTILNKAARLWESSRGSIVESGEKIIEAINRPTEIYEEPEWDEIVKEAYSYFENEFDPVYGGFGGAPKFPTPHNLYFLLRYWYLYNNDHALEMVEKTLDSMARGGIYDFIGFGFSRYSTDRKWLVPHFEKMLYDNALLSIAYVEAYQATRKEKYGEIARQIFSYILRDMTSPDGGFYSAEDADSEGLEGKFYVWSVDEVKEVLGNEDGERYCKIFDISHRGNFEGLNIPNTIKKEIPDEEKVFIEMCRKKLFDHRNKRVHPFKDDKILTSWNGLMIAALSIGGRVLGENQYVTAAEKAVDFIFSKLIRDDGRLMARYRDGEMAFLGYVDDYSFLIWGLIELYQANYNPEYLKKAVKLNDDLIKYFYDEAGGGLYLYGSDGEKLISRPKEAYDGAMPSGNSVATLNFIRLARLTERYDLEDKARAQFKAFSNEISKIPYGYSYFLTALLYAHSESTEVVLVEGDKQDDIVAMTKVLRMDFKPFMVSMVYGKGYEQLKTIAPLVDGYKPIGGKTTAYVCRHRACSAPVTDTESLRSLL